MAKRSRRPIQDGLDLVAFLDRDPPHDLVDGAVGDGGGEEIEREQAAGPAEPERVVSQVGAARRLSGRSQGLSRGLGPFPLGAAVERRPA